jgi:hypothetical protein
MVGNVAEKESPLFACEETCGGRYDLPLHTSDGLCQRSYPPVQEFKCSQFIVNKAKIKIKIKINDITIANEQASP